MSRIRDSASANMSENISVISGKSWIPLEPELRITDYNSLMKRQNEIGLNVQPCHKPIRHLKGSDNVLCYL